MRITERSASYLEKTRVRRSFERAAPAYDSAAGLQREIGARLLEHLDPILITPSLVVDVGAGTGASLGALQRRYRKAHILAVDLAVGMLQEARSKARRILTHRHFVCGDAESLPIAGGCVDLLFSNLTLQWCNDPVRAYREFLRVLAPGGLLVFSTFGPDTLRELRESWSDADGHQHVSSFPDMHDIADALLAAGGQDVVVDREPVVQRYADTLGLMRDLKGIGAGNATAGRARGLTGPSRMRAMQRAYERFRVDGQLPATYEVIYAHAWRAPRAGVPAATNRGSAVSDERILFQGNDWRSR